MTEEKQLYKSIFKSTFLFGFVQIFSLFVKVGLNKAAALLLGVEGIGLIGIFQSISEMLKTFFGLGVSQSIVRDISKANENGNEHEFSEIITVAHKIIFITSLIGAFFTVVFSVYLSRWSFGNDSYTSLFLLLGVVVLFSILADGQLGILKGMRKLRELAKATIFGSLVGFITGVPFYYFFENDGVVPTLLAVAISLVVFPTYYVRKIKYKKVKLSLKQTFSKSSNLIKMGVALMFVTFIGMVSDYVMKIYIGNTSELAAVGVYQAGLTIVNGYFGIVATAMLTDYYPRISAVHNDNNKLSQELNRQVKVGLILITPLIVVFMFLMPFFVLFLYSIDFMESIEYMKYAIVGMLIITVSNPIDIILIAKQNTKAFMIVTVIYRFLGISISMLGFHFYDLQGLGVSVLIMGIIHMVLMQGIMYKMYGIRIDDETVKMLLISVVLVVLSLISNEIDDVYLKYLLGLVLLCVSGFYSIRNFSDITNLNIIYFIKSKSINKE